MRNHAPRLLLLAALAPASLHAQASTTFSSYVAADGAVNGGPTLVGGAVGAELGRVAIRMGGTFDPRLSVPADAVGPSGFWSGEADALYFLKHRDSRAIVRPYLVAGFGVRSYRGEYAGPVVGTMSYGAGARLPLFGGLALEGETRFRHPLSAGADPGADGISAGLEARVGLSFRTAPPRVDTRPAIPVSAPAIPRRFPLSTALPADADATARARLAVARRALDTGSDFLGVRYQWGGNTPSSGFDCSGFIRYVFRAHGIELPRVSRDQARAGAPLPLDLSVLQPGDLMAFASDGRRIDHVAIYAGGGRILHSSSSGGGVRYDDLHTQRGSWYVRHWVAATRVIDAAAIFTQQ